MKLKINKASDLSSISVLPPQSRRMSSVATGAETSIFDKIQASASQLRSQTSQQSFSQGVLSSQHGLFSQISQNSLEEAITNEQRLSSQEREASVKRTSSLVPINYPRDDSQMQISRSSANLMRKWSAPDYKCQNCEELEHKIGMMETSLSRIGMILDSIQGDVMQVNKGTKELVLEMQGVRQKLVVHDDLLQLVVPNNRSRKGQEDIKSSFSGDLKALSGKILEKRSPESSRATFSTISALPQKIETSILKLQKDLVKTVTKEIQSCYTKISVLGCSLQVPNRRYATPIIHPSKAIDRLADSKEMHYLKRVHKKTQSPEIETGGWKSVKHEEPSLKDRNAVKSSRPKGVSSVQLERKCEVQVDSDEDTEGGFFYLFKEMETGNSSIEEARDETQRILRKARRRKRKHSNTIVID